METLKERLQIASLLKKPNLNKALKDLAETLMNDYCINNGQHKYHPIEIEFYIYDKYEHADEHVYERDAKAGRLFFHKSGMDICFDSSIEMGRFGGILIRALEREDGKCFGGPRICAYEVQNTASDLCVICPCDGGGQSSYKAVSSERINVSELHDESNWKDEYFNKKYRFVRQGQEPIKMEVNKYDFINIKIKTSINTYKF